MTNGFGIRTLEGTLNQRAIANRHSKTCASPLIFRERLQKKIPSGVLGILEQVNGIEPSRPAWEAGVLPLNYTCIAAVPVTFLIIHYLFGKINRFFKKSEKNLRRIFSVPQSKTKKTQIFRRERKKNRKTP